MSRVLGGRHDEAAAKKSRETLRMLHRHTRREKLEKTFSKNKSIFERELFVRRSAWNRLRRVGRTEANAERKIRANVHHMFGPAGRFSYVKWAEQSAWKRISNLDYISPFFQSCHRTLSEKKITFQLVIVCCDQQTDFVFSVGWSQNRIQFSHFVLDLKTFELHHRSHWFFRWLVLLKKTVVTILTVLFVVSLNKLNRLKDGR